MSDKKLYTDKNSEQFASFKNSEQFARLMSPSGKKSAKPSLHTNSSAPDIQTRTTYTDKDLEKFEKMFSAGFAPNVPTAPEQDNKAISELPKITKETVNYQASDQDQFDKLLATNFVKKHVAQTSPGGKVGSSKPRPLYTQNDQDQFDQILDATIKAQSLPRNEERGSGLSKKDWRFPELHNNSHSELSSTNRGIDARRLIVERPGKGRIKLKYFE